MKEFILVIVLVCGLALFWMSALRFMVPGVSFAAHLPSVGGGAALTMPEFAFPNIAQKIEEANSTLRIQGVRFQ